ncbi:histidine phosphatase family protein [Phenylobacterium sp.]|uniref:histidine phosphatase family protein n=1 Tax=Phenylobacterium sp. TaxID=1871053 RepID=UPI0027285819|nr:histidine phosphatase family protein [Phenylobacterium sp.]MDO8798752.1 histidine phosphatase family protein [Phenylobacterium sp.]
MPRIYFLTHPQVIIDPAVPVPRWPLSEVGRRRAQLFAERLADGAVTAVWSSREQKALDGGAIIARRLGVPHRIDPELGENDRSATGYIAPPEFWEVVAEFFGKPDESVRGWETARHAQDRIVTAMRRLARDEPTRGDIVVVAHGGVGELLMAHLQGVAIGQQDKPQHPGGGCWIEIDKASFSLLAGWANVPD